MRKSAIDSAVTEAKRFLDSVKVYRQAIKNPDGFYTYEGIVTQTYPSAPKESGAMRRSSLDLTRALAEMRKP